MNTEKIDRAPRAMKTRAAKPRRKPWQPPSMLDAPDPPDGFVHRWIRAEVRGFDDRKNVSARMREEGVFGVGGLLLARIPVEIVDERTDYFLQRNADAMQAVDNDLMKETQHHSMAIQKPERQSRVTFGGPKSET